MGRLLVVILGAGVVLGAAWMMLNRAVENQPKTSEPRRQLDDVRAKAKAIEDADARRAEDALKRTQEGAQ